MPLTLPRRVTFVAKAEYFTTPGHQGLVPEEVLLRRPGRCRSTAPPGRRRRGRAVVGAHGSSSEGDLFGIYPEGTRSHDGRLYRGKTGVARLALETKVPVIPVAVVGTDVVAPPGKKFGTFTRPVVRFGKPLDFSRYEGMENDRYILRSITDEIMYEIMRLSGQEYVDLYAGKAKEAAAKAREEAKRAEKDGQPAGESCRRMPRPSRRRRPDAVAGADGSRRTPTRRRAPSRTGSSAPWPCCGSCCSINTVALNVYRRDNFDHPRAAVAGGARHGRVDGRRDLGLRRPRQAHGRAPRRRPRRRRGLALGRRPLAQGRRLQRHRSPASG